MKPFLRLIMIQALMIAFSASNFSTAQSTKPLAELYASDFESFTAGGQVACQDTVNWTTWTNAPCGPEDPYISAEVASSGVNSVAVENANDLVLLMGDRTNGEYALKFSMLMPSGYCGYYAILQYFEWDYSIFGLEVFFHADGTGSINAGGVYAASFTYDHDAWLSVSNVIDLDSDMAELFIDGVSIYNWQWSLGASGVNGIRQLAAADFFAGADANYPSDLPKYYVDDVDYSEEDPPPYPRIVVNPEAFFQESDPNTTITQTLTIANTGGDSLDFSIDISYLAKTPGITNLVPGTEHWLSVNPSAGTVPAGSSLEVIVTFDADGLHVGTYDGLLSISSNDPVHPVLEVPATLFLPSWGLRFTEDWSSGSFYANDWSFDPDQANWSVTNAHGNPAPSAMFSGSPALNNYSIALVAPTMNATGITDNVTLKFDIELDNYSTITTESMAVEVFDGSGWHMVHEYTNVNGSFLFTGESFNITSIAAGNIFNVRFRAHGENSFNINYWYLDNIMIYQQVVGNLAGTITRLSDGAPVEGAIILIHSDASGTYTDTTGADGVYAITGAESGSYALTVHKEGFNLIADNVTIMGNQTLTRNYALTTPIMVIDPLEINEYVPFDTIVTGTITVSNTGDGVLDWSAVVATENKHKDPVQASDGNFPRGNEPVSIRLAPMCTTTASDPWKGSKGTTGYAFNIYPGNYFFSFEPGEPGPYTIICPIDYFPSGSTFDATNNDSLYVIDCFNNTVKIVDVVTGEYTIIGVFNPSAGESWTGITVDKTTNIMYGIATNSSQSTLYTIDVVSGAVTIIGATGIPGAIDLTIDGTGQMYSFDIVTDASYRIEKETGASTLIGSIGYDANYAQGMAWNPDDDQIYITAYNNFTQSGELRILDRETGNTTLIGMMDGQVDGMAFTGMVSTWLTIDKKSGTLPAGATDTITVTLDGSWVPPREFGRGTITFSSDPDVGTFVVPVNMLDPNLQGYLEGYVTHASIPVPNAIITATSEGHNPHTAVTGPDGHYLISNLVEGVYEVSAEAPGFNPHYVSNVFIYHGDTTTLDIYLTAPAMFVSPNSLSVTLGPGGTATRWLTIANTGDGMLEVRGSAHQNKNQVVSIPAGNGEFPRGAAEPSTGSAPVFKPAVKGEFTDLRGSLGYAFDIGANTFFSFDTDDPGTHTVISPIDFTPAGATFDGVNDDFMYAIDGNTNMLKKVDIGTGAVTDIGIATTYGAQTWTGITFDKTTNIMYGIATDLTDSYLYLIDPYSASTVIIGWTGIPGAIDLTVDGNGEMYSYDIVNDYTYLIDKETATATLLGSLGYDANFAQGMGWDPESDNIYLAAYNNATGSGEFRVFDRMTGSTALIGGMGGEVDGLAFPGGGLNWLSIGTGPIMIPPGSSVQVPVDFDATELDEGVYTGYLEFIGDPFTSSATVAVTLNVSYSGGPTLTIPEQWAPGGNCSVPVHASEITNMGSFRFTIDYDASNLIYTGTSDWYPGIVDVTVGNPSAGKLTFMWTATTAGVTISEDDFFTLHFNRSGPPSSFANIQWSDDPLPREFFDYSGNIFVPYYINGWVYWYVGIPENGSRSFKVFPNPASDIITVKSDFGITGIEVLSSLGQTVYKEYYPGEKEVQFHVSALSAGIYLVKVYTEKGVGMVKVAVGH